MRTEEVLQNERIRKPSGNAKAASHAHSVFSVPTYDDEPAVVAPKKQDSTQRLEKQVASLTQKEKQKNLTPLVTLLETNTTQKVNVSLLVQLTPGQPLKLPSFQSHGSVLNVVNVDI